MGPCHPTLSLLCPPLEGKIIEQPFLLVFKQALKVGFPNTNSLNFKLNRYRNPGIQSKKKAHINKYYNQASHFLRKQIYNQFQIIVPTWHQQQENIFSSPWLYISKLILKSPPKLLTLCFTRFKNSSLVQKNRKTRAISSSQNSGVNKRLFMSSLSQH